MQKWYSTLFHLSPPSRRKFLFTERSLEFQKSQIGPHLHLSLSRCSVFPPPAVRRRWTSSTARPRPNGPRETSQRHLARPLAPPRAHTRPRRLPEPPRRPGRRSAAASSARSTSSRPGPNRPPLDATSLTQELLGL